MHNETFKIKAAFSCNKNLSNSIEELKPFLGFEFQKITNINDVDTLNIEKQILIVDTSCENIKSLEKIKIPKILILAHKEKHISNNKFNLIIRLPINVLDFNQTIIDLSQKFRFNQNSIIKIKNYLLDRNTRFLKRGDKHIKITEKEMNFIIELNNSSKPFSKEYILKKIWGYSSETDTHTIETHIYRLRQKIKKSFEDKDFIKHSKDGYSL